MPLKVLLVEDNPGDARLFQEFLAEIPSAPFRLEIADRLSTALARLAAGDISAVLLDLGLPDSQGFDTFSQAYAQVPGVPILVLTGLDDEAMAVRAVREGAQDYLVKGRVEGQLLVRAIRYAIERKRIEEEMRQLNRDLEQRVTQRTTELQRANEFLRTVVSERKRAEEELTRYFTVSLDLFCIAGFDGYFKRLNPAWEKLLGFPQQELLARPYLDFVHPDDLDATRGEAQKLAAGADSISFENRYRCRDGSYRWLLWKATPALDQQLVYASARDITDRKQAEQTLRDSEEKSRLIVETAFDAFIAIDSEGVVRAWNPAAETAFGWSPNEILGRTLVSTIIPPLYRESHQNGMKRFLATGEGPVLNHRIELTALHKDGHEFPVELTIWPVRARESYTFNAFLHDITERKRAEQALQELNRELEAFTYSVSHDLRAPLRHIDGFSKILLEDYGPRLDPEARRCLDRVREGTRKMGQLIDDLLNLSRVSRCDLRRRPLPLNSLLQEAREELRAELNGREVEWRIGELGVVDADPALLQLAFLNLLSNALKYSRPRRLAVIEIGRSEREGAPVLFVRDNGVGFSMKHAHKLFGVFQRLHRPEDFEGTGVGLTTVQRIIHKHGGRIWAEAELDIGATFFFTLGSERVPPPPHPLPTGERP